MSGLASVASSGPIAAALAVAALAGLVSFLAPCMLPLAPGYLSYVTGQQEAVITVRPGSYTPGNIALTADIPTTLVVRSDNDDGCTRAFVIRGKQYVLPENGDTRIDLGVLSPGTLRHGHVRRTADHHRWRRTRTTHRQMTNQ